MFDFLSNIGTIDTILIAVAAGFVMWFQIRNGSSKVSNDTIEAYKNQVELYEKRLAAQTETINGLTGEVGQLKGMTASKDKQIDDMRKILENRNPELEQVLENILKFMQTVDTRLGEIIKTQEKPVHVSTETHIVKQP